MRKDRLLYVATLLFVIVVLCSNTYADDGPVSCSNTYADDVIVTGPVSGIQSISSDAGIVLNAATITAGADVTTIATFEVHLSPGTRIAKGARLTVRMRDNDGLQNRCELCYFRNLKHGPNEDFDEDLLINLYECSLGTDPTVYDLDNDDDGMEDWWEIEYFGLTLKNGPTGDYDEDGISNFIEYRLGLDPSVSQNLQPGLHYEYDDLGRVTKVQRIPAR